ncbi:uncharacterized protein LOC107980532 isoform X1 [Nasonia vitripennis]|uniref:Spaetzle domain-containing protein n=1 Tax=Nasonia vitripennis TaxID=7425 RepID=A0A7M7IKM1_NASVI|nr:uncharacterized protein LOC107980532 isoform X1 [Nasonia vitripennis]
MKRGLLLLAVFSLCAVLDVEGIRTAVRRCIRRHPNGLCASWLHPKDILRRSQPNDMVHRLGREVKNDQYAGNYYSYSANPEQFRTSCREAICTNALGYPSERINDAVNLVRRIMTSSHPNMVNKRKEIDPEVLNFHSRPQNKVSNEDVEANVDGCDIHANMKRPQEGISLDDERRYLIVNIPSLQQRVQFIECLGGKSEACDVEGDSTCQQAYREESFLALPADLHRRYEARDFKIKKFRVPNGCKCGEGVDLVVNFD